MGECGVFTGAWFSRLRESLGVASSGFVADTVSSPDLSPGLFLAFVAGVLAGAFVTYWFSLPCTCRFDATAAKLRSLPRCNIEVSALYVYPIKSCAGVSGDSALITPRGLEHDRTYMIVDANGRFITQRKCPRMALVRPTISKTGTLVIAAGSAKFELEPRTSGETVTAVVWKSECAAVDQGDDVAAFLAAFLDIPDIRLVLISDKCVREVEPGYVTPRVYQTAFSDGYPFLITSEESLRDISSKVGCDVSMKRFRPNIVLSGGMKPFDEDYWDTVQIGSSVFSLSKICARCKVPTVDPETGKFDTENQPTVALRKFRRVGQKVLFGQNAVCARGEGTRISVGDKVTVESMHVRRKL